MQYKHQPKAILRHEDEVFTSDEHKILQGFQGPHVAERTCTFQGPFIEFCSKLKLIYSVPKTH